MLSTDPALGEYIPGAPINDNARKRNNELPGMGGVFNNINLHLYHYAGNNPVKYTDPDGRQAEVAVEVVIVVVVAVVATVNLIKNAIKKTAEIFSRPNTAPISATQAGADSSEAPGVDAIPDEDKDKIAHHSHKEGHGDWTDLDIPTEAGIRKKIDEVLKNPNTQVGKDGDRATGYLDPDGTLVIHNPADVINKGTAFYPNPSDKYPKETPQTYFDRNFPNKVN